MGARPRGCTVRRRDGGPIDPNYSGAVEVPQSSGLTGQYLEVKRGRPSGVYREYCEDGTGHHGVLYKNGKVVADLWAGGQVRKKESKDGARRVIEWYYRSGVVQKRFVADKNYVPVEPVRLYYESGQLAEEQHFHQCEALCPWRMFFEDGSPKLVAEWRQQQELIVRDAWDDDRRHVVKDGSGTYRDDGRRITPSYALFHESDWTRTTELRDGRPHGKETTWYRGALWSVNHFYDGELHGDATMYWDNGRLRSVAKHVRGKASKTQNYPKFDMPGPAVVVSVEADERLHAAWKQPSVEGSHVRSTCPRSRPKWPCPTCSARCTSATLRAH